MPDQVLFSEPKLFGFFCITGVYLAHVSRIMARFSLTHVTELVVHMYI